MLIDEDESRDEDGGGWDCGCWLFWFEDARRDAARMWGDGGTELRSGMLKNEGDDYDCDCEECVCK